MNLFKRHRYETPTVTVKVDAKDIANLHLDGVQALVTDLATKMATKMAKQEEDIHRLQQAVMVLESKTEPSKVTLYANGNNYTVLEQDKEHIKGTVVGYASKK